MNDAGNKCCSCEELAHGDIGTVQDDERLLRVLTDKHFNKKEQLKPNAFPITDVISRGLSLVRLDHISATDLQEVAENIVYLSKAELARGAIIASAWQLKKLYDANGRRNLCVKDDPVEKDGEVIANPAHAITMATKRIDDLEAQELRALLLTEFSNALPFSSVIS